MIDFVGQASPVSKWKLMGLDALVTALQVLILSVTLERRRVSNNSAEGVDQMASDTRQDHDSEERGILRQDASTIEDLELRDLPHASAGRTGGDQDRERDELLLHSDLGLPDHHPLDSYYTGENIIVNLHIVDTVRAQWQSSGGSAHGSTEAGSSGAQAAAVAVVAGRSLSYRFGETLQQAG